jgi:hypothetical protein
MKWLIFLFSFSCYAQYDVSQIGFGQEPVSGVYVLMPDDAVSSVLPIGFEFCYWGNAYTQFYIGTNGWIGFSSGQPIAFTPFPLPTTNAFIPKNCIMSPFHDLHTGYPSMLNYISYYTTGVAPFRRLVVSWIDVPMYQCTATKSSQQIVIYEGANVIRTNIVKKSTCVIWVNGRAIHGLHNINGSGAVVVAGRNSTTWNIASSGESWEFVPDSCMCDRFNQVVDVN